MFTELGNKRETRLVWSDNEAVLKVCCGKLPLPSDRPGTERKSQVSGVSKPSKVSHKWTKYGPEPFRRATARR